MPIQEKKYKEYLSQEYEPVDESAMPYLVDIRAIKAYADSKGVAIASLSDEEKQQFMIPNPNYRKKRRHGIAAVFWIHLPSYIGYVNNLRCYSR